MHRPDETAAPCWKCTAMHNSFCLKGGRRKAAWIHMLNLQAVLQQKLGQFMEMPMLPSLALRAPLNDGGNIC